VLLQKVRWENFFRDRSWSAWNHLERTGHDVSVIGFQPAKDLLHRVWGKIPRLSRHVSPIKLLARKEGSSEIGKVSKSSRGTLLLDDMRYLHA
jgi:hypothetical protein